MAVQRLPSEAMKFALNASLDTLPNNSNLHMWGKRSSDSVLSNASLFSMCSTSALWQWSYDGIAGGTMKF
jgi:hypothetical protein